MATSIVSFGFKYGGGPAPVNGSGDRVIDVRKLFPRNPYRNPRLRHLRGTDEAVARDIEKTHGFAGLVAGLAEKALDTSGTLYLGCTGGHHRSVFLAERIGKLLGIPVRHRDISKR